MKIKGEYLIREITDTIVAVPVGETVLNSNVLIMLNETGKVFWEKLAAGCEEQELIADICNEYEVDEVTVKTDLDDFVNYLKSRQVEIE